MLDRRTPGITASTQKAEDWVDSESAPIEKSVAERADEHGLPFIERRRRRQVSESWPEALDSVHRHLLGLEQANRSLEESEQRFRGFFERSPLGLFVLDQAGGIVNLNDEMARILEFESAEEALRAARRRDKPRFSPFGQIENWIEPASNSKEYGSVDAQIECRNGLVKWIRLHVRAVRQDSRLKRFEGTAEDISARKLAENRTETLAYYDRLTGLPNRILFLEQFGDILATSREMHRQTALLLLEVDRFRVINDSLGEEFGNRLLQEIAANIRAKAGEASTVARVGSAKFAVVLPDANDLEKVEELGRSYSLGMGVEDTALGHSLNVFCNVGLSLSPDHGVDPDKLVKSADVAQCFAREHSENRFQLFTQELNDKMTERLMIDHGLRRALAMNQLYLEYQPQVDIRSRAIVGLEALLRWKHPTAGTIPPDKFICVAESNGLIVPIGEWVLRNACAQARAWQEQGLPAVPIAVNVSAVQFRQQGFCDMVRKVLEETGIDPKSLELELTESLLLANADVTSLITSELRNLGVKLAIDDFGTGYSNLGYLKHFKVNRLKIDRSFIRDVPTDADDSAITVAIIEMARALNLAVLAEGVENSAQLDFLERQGCFVAQGYYFGRPSSAEQISEWLEMGVREKVPPIS